MSVTLITFGSSTHQSLIDWGYCFSHALSTELSIIIYSRSVETPTKVHSINLLEEESADSVEDETGRLALARIREHYQAASESWGKGGEGKPAVTVHLRKVPHDTSAQELIDLAKETDTSLFLIEKQSSKGAKENEIAEALLENAPQAVLALHPQNFDPTKPLKLLVPLAGGPHAQYAVQLAEKIARVSKGTVTPIYIERDIGEVSKDLGSTILQKLLKKARVHDSSAVTPRVCVSDNVIDCLKEVSQEGFDLILMGSSNVGRVRRLLFKTLPDQLLQKEESGSIGVCRRPKSVSQRFNDLIERSLSVTVPQLEREDRIQLFETLEGGTTWNFDFMALLVLSTAIAALGLIQDSTAVVIGAMLVAPLMTPLLGAGLSLAQGNFPLLRRAAFSVGMGFVLATLVGFTFGYLFSARELTGEIAARGGPTLLDMGIAFFSGLAAAHCVARPNLSAAVAGVAISAALVPPLATIGVALSIGFIDIAEGAALLFGTNVVAIVLGASISIFAAGVRAKGSKDERDTWARRVLLSLLICALALMVPLSSVRLFEGVSSIQLEDEERLQVQKSLTDFTKEKLRGENIVVSFVPQEESYTAEIEYETNYKDFKDNKNGLETLLEKLPTKISSIQLKPRFITRREK